MNQKHRYSGTQSSIYSVCSFQGSVDTHDDVPSTGVHSVSCPASLLTSHSLTHVYVFRVIAPLPCSEIVLASSAPFSLVSTHIAPVVPLLGASKMTKKVDQDGSGEIDFEEFTLMMQAVKKGRASVGWGRINRRATTVTSTSFSFFPKSIR